jgi:hypothetical protein
MRNIFIPIICLLFFSSSLQAQFNERPVINLENKDKKFLNFAYYLGFNQYDFKFDYKENDDDILVNKTFGFNVGVVSEFRINEFFDIRFEPGLSYTSRSLGFPFPDAELIGLSEAEQKRKVLRDVKSTYINFPLLLKASTKRLGNFRPFLVGGLSASLNLGSNQDALDDNASGTFRMKKFVYNYEMGFGIDFYLQYFKFTPSIRGVFAITDELVPDNDVNSPWTGNIGALRTRGVFINFTFE